MNVSNAARPLHGTPGLWDRWLGRAMTERLRRLFLSGLVWNQEIYGQIIGKYAKQGATWLDAGCGHQLLAGGLERLERELTSRSRVMVGADLSVEALGRHASLTYAVCSSLDRLPFPPASFDIVTCNMVVEHLAEPSGAFQELAAVLRPGGFLLIHTPNLANYAVAAGHLVKQVLPRGAIVRLVSFSGSRGPDDIFPTYYRANRPKRLRRLLEAQGLHERECRMLTGPQPFFRFFTPLALLELILLRATLWPPFRGFATSIVGVYQKAGA